MSGALTMLSPAKVNLHLAVGDVRPDGFHELMTVFQAIELADSVSLEPAASLGLTADTELGCPAEKNLAHRAARAFAERVDREPDVLIALAKTIPAGAGLGGGSSNAAAVIAGLALMWGIPPDDARLHDAAASIGADVPFFLTGGTGLYQGRGDALVQHLPTPDLDMVVVWPGTPVSTARAYMALDDDSRRQSAPSPAALVGAIDTGDAEAVAQSLHNDFTGYSADMVEAIGEAIACLESVPGVMGVAMAGSGSGVFGVCDSPDAACEAADEANRRGWWAAETRSLAHGVVPADDGRESM